MKPEDEQLAADWFPKHRATLEDYFGQLGSAAKPNMMRRLVWANPESNNCRIDYVLYGSVLFVCGDLGEAVYQWSQNVSLEFLADCDMDYFGGKCQASDSEPRGKSWNPDRVKRWIESELIQWAADNPIIGIDGPEEKEIPRSPISYEECVRLTWEEDTIRLDEAGSSAGAWAQFISEKWGDSPKSGLIVHHPVLRIVPVYPRAPLDGEEYHIGYEWSIRTRGHLIGLKLAWKQLNDEATQR
jgi:hypothetical protein